MKNIFFYVISLTILASCSSNKRKELITNLDSTSYSLGLLFAGKIPQNLQENHIDSISYEHFLQGIQDYFNGNAKTAISEEQARLLIKNYIEYLQSSKSHIYAEKFFNNSIEGNKFLDQNKKLPNVVELESGLQYQISYAGWGQLKPERNDTILVHFKMLSIKNKLLYDSRKKSNEPQKIVLDSTILAWQKVLPLMFTGAKLKIFSSHEFAYGTNVTAQDIIEPYQTLLFDIELIRVIKGKYSSSQTQDTIKIDSIQ